MRRWRLRNYRRWRQVRIKTEIGIKTLDGGRRGGKQVRIREPQLIKQNIFGNIDFNR